MKKIILDNHNGTNKIVNVENYLSGIKDYKKILSTMDSHYGEDTFITGKRMLYAYGEVKAEIKDSEIHMQSDDFDELLSLFESYFKIDSSDEALKSNIGVLSTAVCSETINDYSGYFIVPVDDLIIGFTYK